jgi:hypothetical protein
MDNDLYSLLQQYTYQGQSFYVVREDLVPFGGGNKVRRYLSWLKENPTVSEIHILSNPGMHSLLSICTILKDMNFHHIKLFLWELNVKLTEYTRLVRQRCLESGAIILSSRNSFFTLVRFLYYKFKRKANCLYSIGGKVELVQRAYAEAIDQCLQQIPLCESQQKEFIHVLPCASGMMVDDFLSYFKKNNITNHSIIACATGPYLPSLLLKIRFFFVRQIHVFSKPILSQEIINSIVGRVSDHYGLKIDPIHGVFAWQLLLQFLDVDRKNSSYIFWCTSINMSR